MTRSIHVRAPCRLHFGMFSFGQPDAPPFGGVGAMIDPPAIEITVRRAARFAARGPLANRVEQFAQAALQHWQHSDPPPCEIDVVSPPDHVGLGVGTQLGLAVAAGLRRYLDLPEMTADEMALSVGRGGRSAVGTYGFEHGGLIVDAGKEPGRPLGKLAERIALPDEWRVALVRPGNAKGLAGNHEADAFARLPPVPPDVTRELWRITEGEILPAVGRRDCRAFGEAVYRFGRLAGGCFASVQGSHFANVQIAHLVTSIREYGVPGVGQSSWGPTVFAFTADEEEAQALVRWLRDSAAIATGIISIARPNNVGAQISMA